MFTSSTSNALRVWDVYLNYALDHHKVQKIAGSSCAQMRFPLQRCTLKLYLALSSQFYRGRSLRTFAFDSLLEVRGQRPESHAGSDVPSLNNLQRLKLEDPMNLQRDYEDLDGELQNLFNEVMSLIKMGKEDDARYLLQANCQSVMELIDSGSRGIEEAAILDVIALGYMAFGDLTAVGSMMEVLRTIVDGLNDETQLLDSIFMHMGSLYEKLEKFDLSIYFYGRSLQILERKYGNDSLFLCSPLLGMAKVLVTSGRAAQGIEAYDRLIKILGSSKSEEGEEMMVPLCEMGNIQLKEGRISDAEYTFSRVLDTFARLYGEEDWRVGMVMCSLAQVKCAQGDMNQAIDLYKNAVRILGDSKHMESDDPVVEKIRIELAELLHVAGRGDEGRAVLEESFSLTEKCKGKEHPSLVPHLVNLATSHSRSKNFVESERLLRIALEILTKNVPPDDPSITFPMLHLAVALYHLHRYEEAEKFARDVLCVREKAFGKESLPVGEALDCLVCIETALEKDGSEVMELLKRVLKIQETHFGHDSVEAMGTLEKLMHYLDGIGIKKEKYPLKRRLSLLREKHKRAASY